jgi:hypothetical protein
MTEQELRALVRDAVARHLGTGTAGTAGTTGTTGTTGTAGTRGAVHPSHAIYLSVVNTSDACVIEPGVECNHCNYCRSHSY